MKHHNVAFMLNVIIVMREILLKSIRSPCHYIALYIMYIIIVIDHCAFVVDLLVILQCA